jgi:hypothetical protein
LRNRAAARRCQTCLQQQGFLSKDEEATCREINQVFATERHKNFAQGRSVARAMFDVDKALFWRQ